MKGADDPTVAPRDQGGDEAATAVLQLLRWHVRRHVPIMAHTLHENGLSLPQMATLHHLHATGPAPVSDLSRHLNLSLTATSHLVQRLVSKGLVTRSEDPRDRRRKRIALDEAGRALVALSHARAAAALEEMLAGVRPARREALERAVSDVLADLDAGDVPA
ncbi:MAG: MarR family transcriptional regulator [Trueperaceae bacterium]|nr:MarR family transcriptional regulator [Trueperaceae bacterium]